MTLAARSTASPARHLGVALLIAAALLSGCAGRSSKADKRATAASLYAQAHKALQSNDYNYAVKQYESLVSRFPFTDQARQARLDLIYAYYRKGEKESAIDAADTFLRENPSHPRIDYAWYMKGLIDYERQPLSIERWMGVDMARRPPESTLKSIAAFSTVVRQYPKSEYAHDAERRIVYLRNRLADYEINVARYYVYRGAWLAAAQRANHVLEQYPGAPAEQEALEVMIDCYHRLGLTQLADNAQQIYTLNFPGRTSGDRTRSRWSRLRLW